MTTTPWRKALASGGNGGSCMEVRGQDKNIQIRDTKDGGRGPILTFTPAEFAAWVDGCRNGEFDDLIA